MLDRVLVPLVIASAITGVGVVGGDVVRWHLASSAADQQAVVAPAPSIAPFTPEPAPVRQGATLHLSPTPAAPSAGTPSAPVAGQPVVVPRTAARVGSTPASTPSPTAPAGPATIAITQANLYQGMSATSFAQDLAAVVSTQPDFVTLNEAGHRTDTQIRPAGYTSYRATGSPYLAETPVLWRTDRWTAVDEGSRWLTTRKVKWGERAVNWVTLRNAAGQVVTVVSAHPAPTLRRTAGLLPIFVAGLADLVHELETSGPVLVGGDFNAGYHGPLWPGTGLAAAGLTSTYDTFGVPAGGTGDHGGNTIDYVFHTAGITPTAQSTRELASDHDAVLATFSLG
ncbi:endonuclease/exonuclease/phosphatase family protein [Nocardioides mangrovi]|uniref:Endonuclease/exonuclease/phosphatase family protein n=1 Tax=Nocardioides mangrovi TaxID=2874580 RepID=A0ABS7U9C7_9ACTN|nr:endonuclease/exonuclease/phosphatase family protein [Nocardioides mangrovi]MBZ5737475.1 endonuclease/exonuclease/phosphatase family protein [Nocardioides mangrovi]